MGHDTVQETRPDPYDCDLGACFAVEPDPIKAAELITAHIIEKRKGLGLSV